MRDRLAEISFKEHAGGDLVVAAIDGDIDGSNAAELRRAIYERVAPRAAVLVLDLTEVGYIDSTGVELIFELLRRLSARRQGLRIVAAEGSGVRRVLELCDVGGVAMLAATRGEALSGDPH